MPNNAIPRRYFCSSCGEITEPTTKMLFDKKLCGSHECLVVYDNLVRMRHLREFETTKDENAKKREIARNNDNWRFIGVYHKHDFVFTLTKDRVYPKSILGFFHDMDFEFEDIHDLFYRLNRYGDLPYGIIKKYLVEKGYATVVNPPIIRILPEGIDSYKREKYLMDLDYLLHLDIMDYEYEAVRVLDYSDDRVKIIPTKKYPMVQPPATPRVWWQLLKSFLANKEQ